MALLPSSSPSTMPAAMASTFFRAPQISTPTCQGGQEYVYMVCTCSGWGGKKRGAPRRGSQEEGLPPARLFSNSWGATEAHPEQDKHPLQPPLIYKY